MAGATHRRHSFEEGSLDQYLRDISIYPLISREQEVELARRIREVLPRLFTRQLLETPRGEYFIVRTDRIVPARTPALNEVEAKVTEAWQAVQPARIARSPRFTASAVPDGFGPSLRGGAACGVVGARS